MQWSKDSLLIKTKRLSQASQGAITLREARVLQLAMVNARNNLSENQPASPVYIHASQYAYYFGSDAGYIALMEAAQKLKHRKFSFIDDKEVEHNWCDEVEYQGGLGVLKLSLSNTFLNELPPSANASAKDFVRYRLESSANLNSIYATKLYDILYQWKLLKTSPWMGIDDLRWQMGIPDDTYLRMSDLKRLVIDHAVNEINALTTMTVSYIQKKSGRRITHLQFQFHRTNRRGKPPTPAKIKADYLASKANGSEPNTK